MSSSTPATKFPVPRRRANVLAALERTLSPQRGLHLAVLVEPYLASLLDGTKPWESRFGVARSVPWMRVCAGDLVVVKGAGAPVCATFTAGAVQSCAVADTNALYALRDAWAARLATPDAFWNDLALRGVRYATFVEVTDLQPTRPFNMEPGSRAGWQVLR